MHIKFTKLQSLGNDYLFVDCLEQKLKHPEEIAQMICNRHFGVGAKGLVLLCPSDKAAVELRLFCANGDRAEFVRGCVLCCAGKFLYEHGRVDQPDFSIETAAGVRALQLIVEQGEALGAQVEVGRASLRARDIPINTEYDDFISQPMLVHGDVYLVTCVSIGSPHAVIFCEELDSFPLELLGPLLEHHERFPDKINVVFAEVVDRSALKLRTWKRGGVEAPASDDAACAAVVAAIENELCESDDPVTVRMLGGEVTVCCQEGGVLLLRAPAIEVFSGKISDSGLSM